MQNANATLLLQVLCRFETEFKDEKQTFKQKLHEDMTCEMKSMSAKRKGAYIHEQMDLQLDVWSQKMMIKFKYAMYHVLLCFTDRDLNGTVKDVAQMLMRNLVNNSEENLTNPGTEEEENQLVINENANCDLASRKCSTLSDENEQKIIKKRTLPVSRSCEECNQDDAKNQSSRAKKAKIKETFQPKDQSNDKLSQPQPVIPIQNCAFKMVAKQSSTLPKLTIKSEPESDNEEECNQVDATFQVEVQSSSSMDKSELETVKSYSRMAIGLGLKCYQLDCPRIFFNEKELYDHMRTKHRIRPFPCLLRKCDKSFDSDNIRQNHVHKAHQNIWVWLCAKCPEHFWNYTALSNHYQTQHLYAEFQCASPNCGFKSELKSTVCYHYVREHLYSACKYAECGALFVDSSSLAEHEQQIHYSIVS